MKQNRLRLHGGFLSLLFAVAFAGLVASSVRGDAYANPQLTEAQAVQIAQTYCRKIGQPVTAVGTATFMRAPEITPGTYWQQRWAVDFPGQARVEVVDATKVISAYWNDIYPTVHQDDLTPLGEAITQQEAIQYAKKALDATGQSETLKLMNAQLFQPSSQPADPPLAKNCFWSVMWYRIDHSVPYHDQYASLHLDAQTGEIKGMVLMFPTPPIALAVQAVSQEKAINTAAGVIVSQGIMASATHTETHLEIIQPNSDQKTVRMAWISTFVVDGHWRQVYLDAETGEILGGGRDNGPAGGGLASVKAPAPPPLAEMLKTVTAIYARPKETTANGASQPFRKLDGSDQAQAIALLMKTTDFHAHAPSHPASEELALVSQNNAIGVYSYSPETGLLGNGSDWAVVPAEFKAWMQGKTASAAGQK